MPIGDTEIQFCGITFNRLQLGSRLPVPIPSSRLREHFMTEGGDGPGIRVIECLGAHLSYSDFNFRAEMITAGELSTLLSAFLDQRTPKTLRIYNPTVGLAVYEVLFAENGFKPDMLDDLSDYEDDYPYAADFELKILRLVSSGGGGGSGS